MTNHEGITLYGVYEAISVSGKPDAEPEDVPDDYTRTITCMLRPGTPDDPYGGWKQEELIAGVARLTLPDGSEPTYDEMPTFGYDDDEYWAVHVENGAEGHYRIAKHTFE